MVEPPSQLDGADVLCWTVSNRGGFYAMNSSPTIVITGMAIARYADGGPFYLFKCNSDWHVVNDWDCGSLDEALQLAAEHSCGENLVWREVAGARE